MMAGMQCKCLATGEKGTIVLRDTLEIRTLHAMVLLHANTAARMVAACVPLGWKTPWPQIVGCIVVPLRPWLAWCGNAVTFPPSERLCSYNY